MILLARFIKCSREICILVSSGCVLGQISSNNSKLSPHQTTPAVLNPCVTSLNQTSPYQSMWNTASMFEPSIATTVSSPSCQRPSSFALSSSSNQIYPPSTIDVTSLSSNSAAAVGISSFASQNEAAFLQTPACQGANAAFSYPAYFSHPNLPLDLTGVPFEQKL